MKWEQDTLFAFIPHSRDELIVELPTEAAYIEIDFHTHFLIHRSSPASINDSVHTGLM
jgi:hypothetical protein